MTAGWALTGRWLWKVWTRCLRVHSRWPYLRRSGSSFPCKKICLSKLRNCPPGQPFLTFPLLPQSRRHMPLHTPARQICGRSSSAAPARPCALGWLCFRGCAIKIRLWKGQECAPRCAGRRKERLKSYSIIWYTMLLAFLVGRGSFQIWPNLCRQRPWLLSLMTWARGSNPQKLLPRCRFQ